MTFHRDQAKALLERSDALNHDISQILALPKRDHAEVGRLAGRQRRLEKRAEVHALLAIAEAIMDGFSDLEVRS